MPPWAKRATPWVDGSAGGTPALAADANRWEEGIDDAHAGRVLLYDAKGDILVGTGDNTSTRLPVGADGEVLVADGGQTVGMRWSPPLLAPPRIRTGAGGQFVDRAEVPGWVHHSFSTAAVTAGRTWCTWFTADHAWTYNQVLFELSSVSATAGALVRVALATLGKSGLPQSLVVDYGTQAGDGAAGARNYTLGAPATHPAGRYLVMVRASHAGCVMRTSMGGSVRGGAKLFSMSTSIQGFELWDGYAGAAAFPADLAAYFGATPTGGTLTGSGGQHMPIAFVLSADYAGR